MLDAGDEHGFDVEGESGKLEVIFEEPEPAKFVISPNTPVREIWISALATSYKLVKPAAYASFEPVARGKQMEIAVVMKIRDGYHVNARETTFDYLIPTDLKEETTS